MGKPIPGEPQSAGPVTALGTRTGESCSWLGLLAGLGFRVYRAEGLLT